MRISRPLPIAIGFSLVMLTGAADATSTTCTTSTVCAEYINSSSGVAIHGEANTGIGIRGTSNGSTGFYGASRSGNPFFAGVEGESLKQTGSDAAGAFGLTGPTSNTPPAYGVLAYGSAYGVYGSVSSAGNGTQKGVPTAIGMAGGDFGGVVGQDSNAGVVGTTNHGTAILGFANTPNAERPIGTFPLGVVGVAEPDQMFGDAIGIEGISSSYPLVAYNSKTNLEIEFAAGGFLIDTSAFYVDGAGNGYFNSITTSNGSYARTVGASGTARKTYAAHTTSPVTEDFGEGQLVNGRGYVRLDPALADVIDQSTAYYVFITPEGDSNGLYVSAKSPAGFAVRESRAGRSTLAFQYRILARPRDDDSKRLAIAPPIRHDAPLRQEFSAHDRAAAQPLDPFVRLRRELGPAAYARMLKAAAKAETGP